MLGRVTYAFRVRVHLGDRVRINADEATVVIDDDGEHTISLRAGQRDASISGADRVAVIGTGYVSSEAAHVAGRAWLGHVVSAFARVNIGADFGERRPGGGATSYGLQQMMRLLAWACRASGTCPGGGGSNRASAADLPVQRKLIPIAARSTASRGPVEIFPAIGGRCR
jgi:hypothetical protein